MVRDAMSCYELSDLVETIICFINSKDYSTDLDQNLKDYFAENTVENTFVFRQDNAACHFSNYYTNWFDATDILIFLGH